MASDRYRIAGDLREAATGSSEATITGGRFTFDSDQIRQVITNWKDLADSYDRSIEQARPMAAIGPPGEEFASLGFATAANASGNSYLAYCARNRDICLREGQRYQDALDAYLGAEERTIIELDKTVDGSKPAV